MLGMTRVKCMVLVTWQLQYLMLLAYVPTPTMPQIQILLAKGQVGGAGYVDTAYTAYNTASLPGTGNMHAS